MTSLSMGNFTKFEPGTKFVDGPELFSVLSQLGIEGNTIGKFHLNPSSSFWGDAITRKIKDGRRRPCLSTDRNSFWYLHS